MSYSALNVEQTFGKEYNKKGSLPGYQTKELRYDYKIFLFAVNIQLCPIKILRLATVD